jgi:predicted dehydrogenase
MALKVGVVGARGIGSQHANCHKNDALAELVAVCDVVRERADKLGAEVGVPAYSSLKEMLAAHPEIEIVDVCTGGDENGGWHYEPTMEALAAGKHVLVEKPMVLDCAEARRVIRTRDKTGRLLSVAFPGSFSPGIHTVKTMIAAGEIGEMRSIVGYCHQNWHSVVSADSWKRDPKISGGGFLFDTGSHLVNTMVDLGGADVKALSVMQDNSVALELSTAMVGRFANGVFFTIAAEGDSVNCTSRIVIIGTKGVLITSMYGDIVRVIRPGRFPEQDIPIPPSLGVFEQFLRVREGKMENPCPAEIGLRFANLMDLVRDTINLDSTRSESSRIESNR